MIVICVIINSITLALIEYQPNEKEEKINDILAYINGSFTLIYFIEFLIKIIASGLAFQKNAYLRDYLNWLDLTIVLGG